MRVYVCSPYGGKQENYEKAVGYCRAVAAMGYLPLASHVMLHGILDDHNPKERETGLAAGLALVEVVDELWVFGETVTRGMEGEIAYAKELGVPVKQAPKERRCEQDQNR